jgi:hypothetical protein
VTELETEIVGMGWELRLLEEDKPLWWAVEPWAVPEAHRLAEKGWLDRRSSGELPEWRLSDRGVGALWADTLSRPTARA